MVEAFSVQLWLKGGREPDHLSRLGEIRAPTLVFTAEFDLADFQAVADLAAARIPGGRRAVLPSAGHLANLENPSGFNALVADFLESVERVEVQSV